MATIDYSSGPRITDVGDHIVYIKATWSASWVAVPNMVCTECQWRAAPDFNTALLTWRMGYVILPGETEPTLFGASTARGYFIRIDWQCEDNTILRWVGFADVSSWPTEAWGDQQIVCYGLERALALTPMMDMAFKRGSSILRSGVPPEFTLTNRAKDPDAGGVYLFSDLMREDWTDRGAWSTRKIVRYLLKYHCPTNSFGIGTIPWSVDQQTQLPDWDTPRIECQGRTVWDVLCELISAEKQLGFTVGSDGTAVYLRCFTHTSTNIVIGSASLLANPNQHTLILSPDALTNASLADVGGGYDQVICRGAKRQTICTLKHTTHIENDWKDTDEEAYEEGASLHPDYDTKNTQQQRRMNADFRHNLQDRVYRYFRIKKTFNWVVSGEPLFDGNTTPRHVRIRDRLPIREDVEWDGDVDPTDADRSANDGRPWNVYFANPDELTKWVNMTDAVVLNAGSVPTGDQPTITISAEARWEDRFSINVNGAPQHAIAGANFTRLPVDASAAAWGKLDYTTMAITCALEEDRYCEGKYPSSLPTVDIVRRLLVDCGPGYRQVRIHNDTIAGLDPDGTEKKVTGTEYLIDDSEKLAALAQVIALGAVLTRKRVNWTSQRRISTVAVGDMINTAEGQAVLAPIVRVAIYASTSVNNPAACPTQSFETFGGSHDPLKVLRNLGMVL